MLGNFTWFLLSAYLVKLIFSVFYIKYFRSRSSQTFCKGYIYGHGTKVASKQDCNFILSNSSVRKDVLGLLAPGHLKTECCLRIVAFSVISHKQTQLTVFHLSRFFQLPKNLWFLEYFTLYYPSTFSCNKLYYC